MSKLPLIIPDGEILIIVPPFAFVNLPSLGVHILQACAREIGRDLGIMYANLSFASEIGTDYGTLLRSPREILAGERLFVGAAYGIPALGRDAEQLMNADTLSGFMNQTTRARKRGYGQRRIEISTLQKLESTAREWVKEVAAAIGQRDYKIVGCTTMFEQTAPGIALLNEIKCLRPDIITIIGGPNCEDEMAEGIGMLSDKIDYIFSGESERTFVEFVQRVFAGDLPDRRIFYGQPCEDLDSVPTPDFAQYYEQLSHYLPSVPDYEADKIEITYETSRGCWWGQKHHCTFCGLNGLGMGFREKSPEKTMTELNELLAKHPYSTHLIQMTDNIMPYTFFKTLVPRLPELVSNVPTMRIYYEQKANLSLEQVYTLMKAGISHIQPGIEALSTSLLKRMDKGVSAAQNIALLRYAHSVGMRLDWNLLWGFPGDTRDEYEETLVLLPLLHHLEPPISAHHLRIDRFSPYFDRPEAYGITNLRPLPSYEMILPPDVDVRKVAYHFSGDYDSASHNQRDIIEEIENEMEVWQSAWDTHVTLFFGRFEHQDRPVLEVTRLDNDRFLLRDTRGLPGTQEEYELNRAQALAALAPRRYIPTPEIEWALAHKVGVVLDTHQYVPLATAEPDLLLMFEAEVRHMKSRQPLFEKVIPLEPAQSVQV